MAARVLTIDYAPRRIFVPYHERTQRWAVIVAHRRAGKTVACINDLIRAAIMCQRRDGRYAYIAPYYVQAKSVAWDYLKRFARPLLAATPNESELRVDLINGARISLYGGDNADRLRGLALDGVILDEYAAMAPSLWAQVVRPALAERQGWATIIGTVKGRNQLWQAYEEAAKSPDWYASILRASETGILPESELADARRMMTPEQYAAEFDCDPSAAILGAYWGKEIAEAERAGRITRVAIDPDLPIHTAWDLGMGDSTAIWLFQAAAGEVRVVGHYENHGQPLAHYVAELDQRQSGYRRGRDFVPHDAKVRSLETGRTRVETLQSLGRDPKLVPLHKLMDGINAVRLMLPRVWFDEGCEAGIECLRQYRVEFDEKTKAYKDTPKHDWTSHSADAFRYLCMAVRDDIRPEAPRQRGPWWNPKPITMDEAWAMQNPQRRDRV